MTITEHASSRRLRLVEAHGYNGLALLTLYDGWRYFEPSDIEGFIAFELHRGIAVACGDPVCAESDLRRLIERFAEYCGGARLALHVRRRQRARRQGRGRDGAEGREDRRRAVLRPRAA